MTTDESQELNKLMQQNRKLFDTVKKMRRGLIEQIKIDSGKANAEKGSQRYVRINSAMPTTSRAH